MAIALQDPNPPTIAGAFDVAITAPSTGEEEDFADAVRKITRLAKIDADESAAHDPAGVEPITKDMGELRAGLLGKLREIAKETAAGSMDAKQAEQSSWLRYGRYVAARDAVGARMFSVDLRRAADDQMTLKIDVAPATNAQMRTVDQSMSALYVAIGETRSVLDTVLADYLKRWVFKSSKTHARTIHGEFTEKLADVARLGLVGGRPELGMLALTDLRDQYVRRIAPIVKNRFMKRLGLWGLAAFVVSVGLYLVVMRQGEAEYWAQRRSFFLLCAGSSVGAWASFAIRNVEFSFVRLAAPEADLLRPAFRIAFVMVLACLAGLALWTRFLSFSINGVSSDLFRSNGSVALLLGALFGLAERSLSTGLLDQAEGVAARFGKKQA